MSFRNTLRRVFSSRKPRRRVQRAFSSESLEQRVVLSAVSGMAVDAPAESEAGDSLGITMTDVLVTSAQDGQETTGNVVNLNDLILTSESATADGDDFQLRVFALADLSFTTSADVRFTTGADVRFELGGQEGSPVTDSDTGDDPTVNRGLSSVPLGFITPDGRLVDTDAINEVFGDPFDPATAAN